MMEHYSTRTLIIALVVVIAPFVQGHHGGEGGGGSVNNLYYTVTKTPGVGGAVTVTVTGRGVHQDVTFLPKESTAVYSGAGQLVIGSKVYCPAEWGKLEVFGNGSCKVYDNVKREEKEETSKEECMKIATRIRAAKGYLFPETTNDNVNSDRFTVTTKESKKTISYNVVGRGVVDVFPFPSSEDFTVYNEGSVLMLGTEVISDTFGKVFVKKGGECQQRGYERGRLVEEVPLGADMCKDVWLRAEAAKRPEADKEHSTYNQRNDRKRPESETVVRKLTYNWQYDGKRPKAAEGHSTYNQRNDGKRPESETPVRQMTFNWQYDGKRAVAGHRRNDGASTSGTKH